MANDQYKTIGHVFSLLRRININPAYFIVPITLSITAASLEGISMGLLIPMLNGFLQRDYSFIKETIGLRELVGFLPESITSTDRTLFLVLISTFVLIILLKNIVRFLATVSMAYLTTRSVHHLRKQLFNSYLSFGRLYFDRTTVGHHSTVLTQFSLYAMSPLQIIDKFFYSLFSLIVYFVVMASISWKLTLLAVPLFVLLHLSVRTVIGRIQTLSRSIAISLSALGKNVVEILSVIPLVKAYNTEEHERLRYTRISDEAATLEFRKTVAQHFVKPLQETITLFALILLFSFMLYLMVTQKTFTPSSFLVYFYVILNATNKFAVFTGFRGEIAASAAPVDEVRKIFDVSDKHFVPQGEKEFLGLRKAIEFRHLTFSYNQDRAVLDNVSFAIERGQVTAIVGPTGAGKSTITSLLLRYYDCPPGMLFLDDTDIRDFTMASLLRHMALVSQDTLLLNETLKYNISYGRENASDADIESAIDRARLREYVQKLPEGIATRIGDRGVKLSGGEKQRLSIARALLKGADILILDEATSSLDSKTEKLIQEAIEDAVKGKTAIVIAHRLSTIKNADKIVVIEHGKCVEQGTLQDLLKQKDRFFDFWEEQKFA